MDKNKKVTYLKTLVGKPYCDADDDGNFIGCLEPMYIFYPELPKFKIPKNKEDFFDFTLSNIEKYFNKVSKDEIGVGDLIFTKQIKNTPHISIYLGNKIIIQSSRKTSMMINKFNLNYKKIVNIYRRKEIN